ncbi:dual specificity tyrosine-phosphorylation-regulated kinase 2-like [Lytechinus variegatus]|uniref:dual specificity tyrosine-phosphorylation-regulated kinase 2-like n=1 Tax=Lytechinus variegatus TaxID=7654 RepID=UPI001BB155F9|nr:dual specificity tyrosine-phosphorylation-regulated kinase 2-like [Lytechinus variegatus]
MWSLGCILAELYLGKPLFWAKQKEELLSQMTSLFGPLPTKVYQRAKFFTQFKEAVGQPLSFMDRFSKFGSKLDCNDFKFVSFLQGMLNFDPSERMSVSEAIQHPFMGPELAIRYVLPFKINGKIVCLYCVCFLPLLIT